MRGLNILAGGGGGVNCESEEMRGLNILAGGGGGVNCESEEMRGLNIPRWRGWREAPGVDGKSQKFSIETIQNLSKNISKYSISQNHILSLLFSNNFCILHSI